MGLQLIHKLVSVDSPALNTNKTFRMMFMKCGDVAHKRIYHCQSWKSAMNGFNTSGIHMSSPL